jgi:hypothetical protein
MGSAAVPEVPAPLESHEDVTAVEALEAADAVLADKYFDSVKGLVEALREQGYIADTRPATTVFLLRSCGRRSARSSPTPPS